MTAEYAWQLREAVRVVLWGGYTERFPDRAAVEKFLVEFIRGYNPRSECDDRTPEERRELIGICPFPASLGSSEGCAGTSVSGLQLK